MKNQKTRLTGGDSVLAVTMRQGKSGINVAATMRTPGEKAQTGTRSNHSDEALAKTAYELLITNAKKKGWTERVRTTAQSFTEIPSPAKSDPKRVAAARDRRDARAAERKAKKDAAEKAAKKGGRK